MALEQLRGGNPGTASSREELSVLRGVAEELGLLGGADAARSFASAFGVKQVRFARVMMDAEVALMHRRSDTFLGARSVGGRACFLDLLLGRWLGCAFLDNTMSTPTVSHRRRTTVHHHYRWL